MILDLPVTFDIAMATADVPRLVRPVVRGLLNRIIGRNPVPEPFIARVARGSGGGAALAALPLEPRLPRADRRCCPATPTATRSAGSRSTPATSSTPSTPTTTATRVVVDVVRHPRMFDTVLTGPDEGPTTLTRFTLDLATGRAVASRGSTSGRRSSRGTTSD